LLLVFSGGFCGAANGEQSEQVAHAEKGPDEVSGREPNVLLFQPLPPFVLSAVRRAEGSPEPDKRSKLQQNENDQGEALIPR